LNAEQQSKKPNGNLHDHVDDAAQQLIEPEPMELAFHPQGLNA
jgi:hypothetical protein